MALLILGGKDAFSMMAALRWDTVNNLATYKEGIVPCASRAVILALSLSLDAIAEDTHNHLIRMRLRSKSFFAVYILLISP